MATARKRTARRKPEPVEVISPRPAAWLAAKQLAEGRDVVLVPQPDGSVLIANRRA